MRKALLTMSAIILLSSFTNQKNETITLTDIEGTLLKSYVDIVKVNGEYIATFTVDANTVVTSNTIDGETHVYLVENGTSNTTITQTVAFKELNIDFTHYFEGNIDLASNSGMIQKLVVSKKPKGEIEEM